MQPESALSLKIKQKSAFQLLITLFLLIPQLAISSEHTTIIGEADSYLLYANMLLLEDKENQLTIHDVDSKAYSGRFTVPDTSALNPGLTTSTIWLKINIMHPGVLQGNNLGKRWYLEVGRSQINEAELYIPANDSTYHVQRSDLTTPFSERSVRHINSVFLIETTPGQKQTFYIRIKSQSTIQLPVILWDIAAFTRKTSEESFGYGLFYGSMLMILLYNLIIYFSVRDTSYLVYVSYIGSAVVFLMIYLGHSIMLFGDSSSIFDVEYLPFYAWFSYTSALIFFQRFLQTKINHPNLDPIIRIFYLITGANAILSLIVDYWTSVNATAIFVVVSQPLLFALSYQSLKLGNENSKPFFYTVLSNFIGSTGVGLVALGAIPSNALTNSLSPLGVVIGSLVLSFALANRIKRTKNEVLRANTETVNNLTAYYSIYNNSIEGMYLISLNDNRFNMNNAILNMLGLNKNISISELAFHLGYTRNDSELITQLYQTGHVECELLIRRSKRGDVYALHTVHLDRNTDNVAIKIRGTLIDITEQKENALSQKESLREKIEKEVAQNASTSRNQFLNLMSHDIRTPLTAILGYGELLKDGDVDNREKGIFSSNIIDSSYILLGIINDILDFSKIEAKRMTLETLPVNILSVVKEVELSLQDSIRSHQVDFVVNQNPQMPAVLLTDPTRFRQVIYTLSNNALRKTHNGRIIIELSWLDSTSQIKVTVSDTGEGYSTSQLASLFDIFSQDSRALDNKGDGVKLDLVLANSLVELMNGSLRVVSTMNKGSCFTVLIKSKIPSGEQRAGAEKKYSSTNNSSQKKIPTLLGNILLVEDNRTNQMLISRIIAKTGLNVTTASNGREAVDLVVARRFDLVLMDINMPIMGGLEATRKIMILKNKPPIYALSADDSPSEIKASMDAGCKGHFSKPLNTKDLYAMLKFHFD
ncbi:hypothetical protein A9Q99_00515 [Gammaproteobacteria bacterium 45_16_T64]|nr:hypothetical protein A9Q99_00515 [Gammaproteobacteria bacterium 45_16_T64]